MKGMNTAKQLQANHRFAVELTGVMSGTGHAGEHQTVSVGALQGMWSGPKQCIGFFQEAGWIGVIVSADDAPEWWKKQHEEDGADAFTVFGAECVRVDCVECEGPLGVFHKDGVCARCLRIAQAEYAEGEQS